jgi:hypothetical protein
VGRRDTGGPVDGGGPDVGVEGGVGGRVTGMEKMWDLKRRIELRAGVAEAEERIRRRLTGKSDAESMERSINALTVMMVVMGLR